MTSLSDLRPLHDGVLLLRLPALGDGSRIVIPDVSKVLSKRGQVVRFGPGKRRADGSRKPVHVHAGDVVHYQSNDYDDGDYILIAEGDILGIEQYV